jgi:hypothetical protein
VTLDVSGIPRITGWAKPLGFPAKDHGVIEIQLHGSVLTACRGRWASSEPTRVVSGRDRDRDDEGRKLDKCEACDEIAKEQRTLDGLAELKHAPLIETRPFPDFDFSDEHDEDYDDERSYDDRVGAEDLDDGPSACIGPDCCNANVYHRRDECFTAEMMEAYEAEIGGEA